MPDLKYYDVILKPIVTEKTMNMSSERKYCFYVHVSANKTQVKEAIEKIFDGVKVDKVNIMNCRGKLKRRGKLIGRRVARKKAIVKLQALSKDIELFAAM